MHFRSIFALFAILLLGGTLFTACDDTDCSEVICTPCPSTRLFLRYEDSTGCYMPANPAGWVTALDATTGDTLYQYAWQDSCEVSFIVDRDVEYVVTGGTVDEHIHFEDFTWQEPVFEGNECCPCYPIEEIHVDIGSDHLDVDFPEGSFTNEPIVRTVN